MEFTGFRDEAFAFFRDLSANNSEEWFEANQARFEECVVTPMRALVAELKDELLGLHPHLVQDDIDAHFSEMRRGPQSRADIPPIKTSFYCFFWDTTVRRLTDAWFFVGVGADGVQIGMSIYDFGDPESRMRRIFKPRLRRYLTYLDDFIKANYLRRGFDFHRYVRAAGKLGIREVDAFPTSAAEWDSTLGWVVKRHLHTESSRLTPGSFVTEVRESFQRLYPLYSFASDPREEFLRLIRVPARARALQANGATTSVTGSVVAAAGEPAPAPQEAPATTVRSGEKTKKPQKAARNVPAKQTKKKKAVAKKPAAPKAAAPKRGKAAAKKKTATKKTASGGATKKAATKGAAKKKSATRKKKPGVPATRKPTERAAKKSTSAARKRATTGTRASARSR